MSGTSLDGVDAVIADFARRVAVACAGSLGAAHVPFAQPLRDELLALQRAGDDELARAARAANALADLLRAGDSALRCARAGIAAADVVAAGVHGQTLRHRPDEGWTLQLNNPARVAERADMTVVADFRSRDVAAGGQGAPLVPAFHAALFRGDAHRVVVNIGGIANVTDLPPRGDRARLRHRARQRAARPVARAAPATRVRSRRRVGAHRGASTHALLAMLLAEPYFARVPPKSTGRDLFNAEWLDARLARPARRRPPDVQATLVRADRADDRRRRSRRTARRRPKCSSAAAARTTRR